MVIKVGGSLQKGKNLSDLCKHLGSIGKQHKIIIIPGGGIFADAVRECARNFNLDQDTAHWMAILAMNQYGYLLSSWIPGSSCTDNIDEAKTRADKFQPVVFLPYLLLKDKDPLPHSWDVTSDSIAAWIAGYINSKKLLLLKSGNLQTAENIDEKINDSLTLEKIEKTNLVDPIFYSVIKNLRMDLWIINGNKPEQLNYLFPVT